MSLLPQIGFLELMVLAVLALVVVGPKDLPKLMRGIGKFLKQARSMADEFRAGFDEMARESEMADLRNEIENLKKNNPVNEVKKAVEDTARQADADRYPQVKGTPKEPEKKADQASEQSDAATMAGDRTNEVPAGEKKAEGGA